MAKVKRSTLAGAWYPGDAEELRSFVDAALEGESHGAPFGVVVPHAGYVYSGRVAGAAYRELGGRPVRRIAVLAPSHRYPYSGIAVPDADAFATPLGEVAIDPVTARLGKHAIVSIQVAPFQGEHSLEIQLPFLQRLFPSASVVPLLFGSIAEDAWPAVVSLLADLDDDDTAFVVSSDFTHYGGAFGYLPFPATSLENVRRQLRELDMGAVRPILNGDAAGFRDYVARTGITVCGRVPIRAFLEWGGGRMHGDLLDYRTSIDATGDYEHAVSYAAIALER